MLKRFTILTALLALLAACAGTPTPGASPTDAPTETRRIRLPMGYIPDVQFAPFYVAVEKGYFAAEGLEVEFDYSFETNGVQLVAAGELPFAVASGEQVLLARAQGLPVVYVMAWYQDFPVAVIAKAESGLTEPGQLSGKRIGVPLLEGASFVGLQALLTAAGVPVDDVFIEVVGFNQAPALTSGQIDAAVVYSNNEPIRLAAQGEALTAIAVSDYVALAANGLLSSESVLANEPELARSLVRALLRGIADTLADPGEAFSITTNFVEGMSDLAVERAVLDASIEMWRAERPGYSEPAAWDNMHATLLETGLLAEPQDVSRAYSNEFLP